MPPRSLLIFVFVTLVLGRAGLAAADLDHAGPWSLAPIPAGAWSAAA